MQPSLLHSSSFSLYFDTHRIFKNITTAAFRSVQNKQKQKVTATEDERIFNFSIFVFLYLAVGKINFKYIWGEFSYTDTHTRT